MSNVTEFPRQPEIVDSLFGPETKGNALIVDGRVIPGIIVRRDGNEIEFVLDGRFSFSFSRSEAWVAASFAAQAMAIGAGYSHLGAPSKDRPFAPQAMPLPELTS